MTGTGGSGRERERRGRRCSGARGAPSVHRASRAAPRRGRAPTGRGLIIVDLYWDPFDVEIDTAPYEIWRRLRDDAPVYRNETYDFWALSRFADVEAAHRDPESFSSAHGTVLEMMRPEPMSGRAMMIFVDPPDHTSLRALVSKAFTPRRVSELEDRVRDLCRGFLDEQRGRDSFDFLQDYGARLPAMVIANLLGVPPADQERVRHLIDTSFHLEPGVGMVNDTSIAAIGELNGYLAAQLDERRRSPCDDMFTDLVHAQITDEDGVARVLSPEECAGFAGLLIHAGTETVARLLGWAGVVLAEHPEQRAELVVDPGLVPGAVEELLRYEAPSPVQGRFTHRDVELHGVRIPEGSKVLLLTGSAGRDERRYRDPERFDIHRRDSHVSFGFGIHFCLGAALARLEGRVALEEMLARHPTWEVDHDRAVRLHTSTVRGYAEVPIIV